MMSTFVDDRYLQGDGHFEVPAHLNFGKYMLSRLLLKKDEVALENGETGETLTYKEITQYAVDLSVALIKLGIGRGDLVGLGSERRITYMPTALAVLFTGAAYTPFNLMCGRAYLKQRLSSTKPTYFICSETFWNNHNDVLMSIESIKTFVTLDDVDGPSNLVSVNALRTNCIDDVTSFEPADVEGQVDTAVVLYSSGTTGLPKPIELTHLNCILNSLPSHFSDKSLNIFFILSVWDHNYDTFMTFRLLASGKKVVYVDQYTEENVYNCIQNYKINVVLAIPSTVTMFSKIHEDKEYNFDALKIIYSRGSSLHVKTIEKLRERFPQIDVMQGYGMTESGEPCSQIWGSKGLKSHSVGQTAPSTTLKVVDVRTREVLGPNEHGEICLKGPLLSKGYIGADRSSYMDEDGFFKTGDLGYYDEDRYVYVIDRLREVIEFNAMKIHPLELESILLLHPEVKEAGMVGKPDPVYGEIPVAFVVKSLGSSITEQELMAYITDEVNDKKRIQQVIFITDIPKNPRGKFMRRRLREMLTETK